MSSPTLTSRPWSRPTSGVAARATLALHRVKDSAAYGLVRCSEQGEVLSFEEKTGEPVPGAVNAGMYALDRSVLELVPAGREVSIEREVFPRLVGQGLRGLELGGYWMDIGTPERYLEATWDILEGRVETRSSRPGRGCASTRAPRSPRAPRSGRGSCSGRAATSASGAEIRESVLLDGCRVGMGASLSRSVLGPGVEVADGAALEGAVVGRDERVSA